MSKKIDIYTDGACSGNPGLASVGVQILEDGSVVREISRVIGNATNNIAEYSALIDGLQEALILRRDHVVAHTDSELMYKQIKGLYRVRDEKIRLLFNQVMHLAEGFKSFEIVHHPRFENAGADKLAKQAIRKEQAKMAASKKPFGEESPSSTG